LITERRHFSGKSAIDPPVPQAGGRAVTETALNDVICSSAAENLISRAASQRIVDTDIDAPASKKLEWNQNKFQKAWRSRELLAQRHKDRKPENCIRQPWK
jgi:hypothetical protein